MKSCKPNENLIWKQETSELTIKLNRGSDILSKLKHKMNKLNRGSRMM